MDPFELDPSLATPDEGPVGPPELSVAPVAPVPDVGLLPPTEPLLGAPPRLTVPPPPPPPPSPMSDPKQQLLAIIALGLATGQGVRGGGAGALHGFNETQKALRQDQLSNYQRQVNEQRVQDANARTQFAQDEITYRQREQRLQSALANFKTQASKVGTKAEYDGLADAYGNSLRAAGYRTISPDWLRANVPYVKPSQKAVAERAFEAWQKNPNNKRLLDQNPELAAKSVVKVDLNQDGIEESIPLANLADAAGHGFAMTDQGLVAVPVVTKAGQSEFQVKYASLVERFKAENRRDPTPPENDTLVDKAIAATKTQPVVAPSVPGLPGMSPADRVESAAQDLIAHRMAPSQLATFFTGMGKDSASQLRSLVMQRVKQIQPDFNFAQSEADYQFGKSANTQSTVRFLNNIEKTLPVLRQASADFKRSNLRILNKAALATKSQFGATDVVKFEFARNILADEIAKILQGGGTGSGTSDAKLRQAQDLLASDMTPAQLDTALNTAQELLRTRRESLTQGTFMENTAPPKDEGWTDLGNGLKVRKKAR